MSGERLTLSRLWLLLKLIPREPRFASAAELTERLAQHGHSVTKRSVERNLKDLSTDFPLVCDDSKVPFGWAWMKHAAEFSLSGMSPIQALVLLTAEAHLGEMLPKAQVKELEPMFEQARLAIVRQQAKPGLSAWPTTVVSVPHAPPTLPPTIKPAILQTLQDAVLSHQAVKVSYRARSTGATKTYTAHPIGFIHRASITYLGCTINDYSDPRLLALHRVASAELLEERAREHPRKILRDLRNLVMAEFADRGVIQLILRVDAMAADSLRESPLSKDQIFDEGSDDTGSALVRASVRDTDQLRWWLLGHGDRVEVVAPDTLRCWAEGVHERALERYRDTR